MSLRHFNTHKLPAQFACIVVIASLTSTFPFFSNSSVGHSRLYADSKPSQPQQPDPAEHKPKRTHPITVKGRALNEVGEPVAGAHIFIASLATGTRGRLAETRTDALGNYEFQKVLLPISTSRDDWDIGTFQVFGQADKLGFAWRSKKDYYPEFNPNPGLPPAQKDVPDDAHRVYSGNQPIILDLQFPRAAILHGQVRDDLNRPLKDVKLILRYCHRLNLKNFREAKYDEGDFATLTDGETGPVEMTTRITDAAGRFEFQNLPPRSLFWISVSHADIPTRIIYAATTRGPLPKFGGQTVHAGEIPLEFPAVSDAAVQVLYSDTHEPAQKVFVEIDRSDLSLSVWKSTDATGRALFRLPSGDFTFRLLPQTGTPYLPTTRQERLTVQKGEPSAPLTLNLQRGCPLTVSLVDDRTGLGIPDVDLWMRGGADRDDNTARRPVEIRSWEVATRRCPIDRPLSDREGHLRATVPPGRYSIGAGFRHHPDGYETDDRGQEVEFVAGKNASLTIRLKPEQAPNAKPKP